MQYFIMMPGDGEHDSLNEANLLGEASFGTFWPGTGLNTLMEIVDKDPEVLAMIKIRTDMSNKMLSIEDFLTIIQKLKMRTR